ncbi:hypothetical protein ACLIIZ_09770 [Azonexus caeni]|jgi:NhaP-type Na+/H+ or K+/H+ antiporter|uniref:hypothetical protein n=1 Tax=Azonexus caeni TaxID=266126 RepID=UPI003A8754CA
MQPGPDYRRNTRLALGVCAGIAAGVSFGDAIGNPAISIGIGAALGTVLGVVLTRPASSTTDAGLANRNAEETR